MQDLTICPSCRLWKDSLRVMPCCQYKFCDECVWKSGGCFKCNNRLDFQLLRIYKPIDVLIKECLVPCRHCNELHTTFMVKSHEGKCPKSPISELVKELADDLPPAVREKSPLTEEDMKEFYIRKNLMQGFQLMLDRYASATGADGFINHVISETDTLSGIALRYGVSANEIRKVNGLIGNGDQAIYKHVFLRIPANPQHIPSQGDMMDEASYNILKRRTISRFARKSGCNNNEEALYYLEAHHFDFDKAMAEFRKDEKTPFPTPPSTISTYVPKVAPSPLKANRSCCISFFS